MKRIFALNPYTFAYKFHLPIHELIKCDTFQGSRQFLKQLNSNICLCFYKRTTCSNRCIPAIKVSHVYIGYAEI